MISANSIFREVAWKHRISVKLLKSREAPKRYFDARSEVCTRLRSELKLSYPKIGILMDGRDHTTIISLIDKEIREKKRTYNRANYHKWPSTQKRGH
jgi:chromosomal replication initiation ATPase DnaA